MTDPDWTPKRLTPCECGCGLICIPGYDATAETMRELALVEYRAQYPNLALVIPRQDKRGDGQPMASRFGADSSAGNDYDATFMFPLWVIPESRPTAPSLFE